jgi:hypothetical protein
MPGLAYAQWNNQQAVLGEMRTGWGHGPTAPIPGVRSDRQRTFTAFSRFATLNVQRKFGATEFYISLEFAGKDTNNGDTFTVYYTGKTQAKEDFKWEVGTIADG